MLAQLGSHGKIGDDPLTVLSIPSTSFMFSFSSFIQFKTTIAPSERTGERVQWFITTLLTHVCAPLIKDNI